MHQDNVARCARSGRRGQARGRDQRSGSAGNQGGRKGTSACHHDTNSINGKGSSQGEAEIGRYLESWTAIDSVQHLVVPSGLPDMLELLLSQSSMYGLYEANNWGRGIMWTSAI